MTWYPDSDNDGYGDDSFGMSISICYSNPSSTFTKYIQEGGDCDDNDTNINPDKIEILNNNKDDDCDPSTLDIAPLKGDSFELNKTEIHIYPNPNKTGIVNIDLPSHYESVDVIISNSIGKQILPINQQINDNTLSLELNVSSGVYMITSIIDGQVFYK